MDLIKAYNQTHYITNPGLTIKIGCNNPELDSLLEERNCSSAFFLTAWNPFSKIIDEDLNKKSNNVLYESLKELVDPSNIIHGIGLDPSGIWEGEESFLVLGLKQEESKALAVKHGQNAFVKYSHLGKAELIMTVHFKMT